MQLDGSGWCPRLLGVALLPSLLKFPADRRQLAQDDFVLVQRRSGLPGVSLEVRQGRVTFPPHLPESGRGSSLLGLGTGLHVVALRSDRLPVGQHRLAVLEDGFAVAQNGFTIGPDRIAIGHHGVHVSTQRVEFGAQGVEFGDRIVPLVS